MQTLIAELSNYNNALIVALTWAAIEGLTPIIEGIVMLPALLKYRLTLYGLQKNGKRIAGILWCSILVWVPMAQPSLCSGVDAGTCQTIFQRVALGVILGALLSSGHWGMMKGWRKFSGSKKVVKIVCASCGAKNKVESLDERCPKCGEKPYEVSSHTRTV